jgi:hypothetical protein
MQTHSTNSLAEMFEVDRATIVKALRNVPPDSEKTKGRPTFKVSTAARALDAHRRNSGNAIGNRKDHGSVDPRTAIIYSELDAAEAAMRELSTLAKRRVLAVNTLRPIIDQMQRMFIVVGGLNGEDTSFTGLKSDDLYRLALRGLENPCQWSTNETWTAMNAETD